MHPQQEPSQSRSPNPLYAKPQSPRKSNRQSPNSLQHPSSSAKVPSCPNPPPPCPTSPSWDVPCPSSVAANPNEPSPSSHLQLARQTTSLKTQPSTTTTTTRSARSAQTHLFSQKWDSTRKRNESSMAGREIGLFLLCQMNRPHMD